MFFFARIRNIQSDQPSDGQNMAEQGCVMLLLAKKTTLVAILAKKIAPVDLRGLTS